MRIGQCSDSFLPVVDGVGRVVASYAESMGERGHTVSVFAPKANMGDISQLPYQIVPYNAVPIPGKLPYRIGFPQLDLHFERHIQDIELDIMHIHSPFMSGHFGAHLAKKRNLPLVGSFHSKYYDDFVQTLKADSLAKTGVKLVVDLYSQCDEVWAVSEGTAQTLRSYGYEGKIAVMPNGTDVRTLDATVLPELTARYGLSATEPLLLYVGQINEKKNIPCILDAAALLRQQGQPFRLLLAGQGPHQDEFEGTIRRNALENQVSFIGHITNTRELDGLYSLSSLFVFPSLYDNAPMVVREAAAMGTPSLLVQGSSSAEVVQSGVNGLTCENSPASVADAIRSALSDPARLAQLGEAARQSIAIPWSRLMDDVLGRYERLLQGR